MHFLTYVKLWRNCRGFELPGGVRKTLLPNRERTRQADAINSVIFEAFEASALSKDVLASKAALQVSTPSLSTIHKA